MNLPPFLTEKMAGAPRWVWGVGLVGGVGVGLYLRNRNSDVAPERSGDASTTTTGPNLGNGDLASDTLPWTPGTSGGYSGYSEYGGGATGFTTGDIEDAINRGIQNWIDQNPRQEAYQPPPPVNVYIGGTSTDAVRGDDLGTSSPTYVGGGGAPVAPARRTQVTPPVFGGSGGGAGGGITAGANNKEAEINARTDAAMAIRVAQGRNAGKQMAAVYGRDRARVKLSAQRHPEWGPHTLAKGGRHEGHSEQW